jgi:phosphate transport system substrate-binding protein
MLPAWPTGFSTGATGSGDMVNKIKTTPYSLGFVGFDYAIANKMQAAAIRNASGVFQTPSLNGVAKAIAYQLVGPGMPIDFRRSFVTVPGKDAYNPADFEFWLVHRDLTAAIPTDPTQRKAIKDFLNWSIQKNGGQQFIEEIALRKIQGGTQEELAHGFVPVPDAIRRASQNLVNSLIS